MLSTTPLIVPRTLSMRDIPRIGGSSPGFIALIVILILIIVVSCIAIVIILRKSWSPRYEARRNNRRQSSQAESSLSTTECIYTPTITPAGNTRITWMDKVSRVVGFGPGKRGRGAHGWVQARSGDEWDPDEERGIRTPPRRPDLRERDHDRSFSASAATSRMALPMDEPFRPPPVAYAYSQHSASSVRVDVNLPGPLLTELYAPPIADVVLPGASSPRSQYQLYSLPRSPTPETMIDSLPGPGTRSPASERDESRQMSSPSTPVPARTFPGGTRFIESL